MIKLKIILRLWEEFSFVLEETTVSCEIHVRVWIWTAPKMQQRSEMGFCDPTLAR